MSLRFLLCILAGVAGAAFVAPAAMADETGMASIHTWRTVGSKTCLVDHFHDGSGTGRDQQKAVAEAIRNWQSFTDLEYGSDWASYANAMNKSVQCSRTGDVTCRVEAIPCKGGVLVKQERKPSKRRSSSLMNF